LKSFKAGEYSIDVTCEGINPVNSIDFSTLGTVNAAQQSEFLFPGANMTTNAVDAAFNSFPMTYLQLASAAPIVVQITGTSQPPSPNSQSVRDLIVAGGGVVITN
jgi:hypothetical protein